MRAVTTRLSTERGWFDPFDKVVLESKDITREAIHEMRLVGDGTAVMLYEYSGDSHEIERVVEEHLEATHIGCQMAEMSGNLFVYANVEPNATVTGLLWALDQWKLIVDPPMRFSRRGDLLVTLIGEEAQIRDALSNLPEEVRVTIERTGALEPELDQVLGRLTPRERETLRVAVEMGYYSNPRGVNYEEIAERLDRTAGTVGQHLRNAESKVMGRLLEGRMPDRQPRLENSSDDIGAKS